MTTTTKTRPNKYRGKCSCGRWVGPGAGTIHKVGSRWNVKCSDCNDPGEDTRTWKQTHGRCEDAPCCGCGGACGTPLGYGFPDGYYDDETSYYEQRDEFY